MFCDVIQNFLVVDREQMQESSMEKRETGLTVQRQGLRGWYTQWREFCRTNWRHSLILSNFCIGVYFLIWYFIDYYSGIRKTDCIINKQQVVLPRNVRNDWYQKKIDEVILYRNQWSSGKEKAVRILKASKTSETVEE